MWTAEQKRGLAIACVGHAVYVASRLALGDAAPEAAGYAGGAVAAALMIYGSALYVRGKGYAALWGLGGFLPFLGLGTLMLIPSFPGAAPAAPPPEAPPAASPPREG